MKFIVRYFIVLAFLFAWNANGQINFKPGIKAFVNHSTSNFFDTHSYDSLNCCFTDTIHFYSDTSFLNDYPGLLASDFLYEWKIEGLGFKQGTNFIFKPTGHSGYYIKLKITYKPSINSPTVLYDTISCKVRVSSEPNFSLFATLPSEVCMEKPLYLPFKDSTNGSNSSDPIQLKLGSFSLGGVYKADTPLPDGSQENYVSTITIDDYGNNAFIKNAKDIDQMCISMEHSFLGDLEMTLTCPTGQTAVLFNSSKNDAGMVPSGFNDGKHTVFLGNDTGNDLLPPSDPHWQYCFSSTINNFGTFADQFSIEDFAKNKFGDEAMRQDGIYSPEESFEKFIGCPVKGNWKITVRDNSSEDNGFIFDWGILFNAESFPFLEKYQNKIVKQGWEGNPTQIKQFNDTTLRIIPNKLGQNQFVYYVETDYGCKYYDTIHISTKLCLTIPNVLALSSKEGNDKFFINTGDVKEFKCSIYNRWGNLMFTSTDVHEGWDGKTKSGKLAEEGTYFYVTKIIYNNNGSPYEINPSGYFDLQH